MQMSLDDIKENKIVAHHDYRGEIFTTYKDSYDGKQFNHDKVTIRYKDTLVGIHGDFKTWKLVSCLFGRVFTVLVDNREESCDYLKCREYILSQDNKMQLLIPPGIGNSFFVLSEVCVYNYLLSYEGDYVDYDQQFTLKWNDPRLNIKWPHDYPILSARDA